MGVTGLWKLIDQAGKPVPLETLENKVLAIDISIWLYQVTKGFQDSSGAALPHAHLLGLFHRLCKLLFYRIKPIFVFDGGVPYLKRDTMMKRNQQRSQIRTEADRLQQRLLESLAREKIVQHALGDASAKVTSPHKQLKAAPVKDDLFKLPPLTAEQASDASLNTTADSESSFDEKNSRQYYNVNLQSIDVTNKHFQSLPADVRHDILTDIKETRKESSWGRLHELPAQSDDFSEFQMLRLLKRRKVQQSLEDAEKEMGGKSLSLSEIEALLKEEGVVSGVLGDEVGNRLSYNENTRYLHVRDIRKAMKVEEERAKASDLVKEEEEEEEDEKEDVAGELHDEDLQRAIQMSLEECCADAQKEASDVAGPSNASCNNRAKLRTEQKRLLGKAAKSLAKAYMVEYGGLNADDVDELVEIPDDHDEEMEQTFKYNDSVVYQSCEIPTIDVDDDEKEESSPPKKLKLDEDLQVALQLSMQGEEKVIDSDAVSSSADSDFVDVPEWDPNDIEWRLNSYNDPLELATNIPPSPDPSKAFELSDLLLPISEESKRSLFKSSSAATDLEVIIRPEETVDLKDDIFADVFEAKTPAEKISTVAAVKMPVKCITSLEPVAARPADILSELKLQMDDIEKITMDSLVAPVVSSCVAALPKDKPALNEILSSLNKEMSSLVDVNLDTILPQIKTTETAKPTTVEEVIEIDDDAEDVPLAAPKKSKQTTLSSFIDVAITPKKPMSENIVADTSDSPKIASPFFRNKTPSSSKKKSPDAAVVGNASKVAKALFATTDTAAAEQPAADTTPKPPAAQPPTTSDDVIVAAASVLRTLKTTDELTALADAAQQETNDLRQERNKQDRFGANITERMSLECKQLLRLFGIPYIVAPKEAEAQCAFLEATDLTDGTITDDSDIWLFGGRTVYKHFFNQQKNVLEFRADTVERAYNVQRSKLIQLAMLVGSDYTTGIHGIGTVTALEILATFSATPVKPGETTDVQSTLSGLRKFKEWWQNGRNTSIVALRKKLKNITFTEDFPSRAVVDAYLYPEVENFADKFAWGTPDAESIREFAKLTFGWTHSKTDDTLLPVLRKLNEKRSQVSIRNYFASVGGGSVKEVTVSKRVRHAINKMSADGVVDVDADDEAGAAGDVAKKARRSRAATKSKRNAKEKKSGNVADTTTQSLAKETTKKAKTSEMVASTSRVVAAKRSKVPDFSPPIQQREKAAEEMKLNKQNAIRLFKENSAKAKKKNKSK